MLAIGILMSLGAWVPAIQTPVETSVNPNNPLGMSMTSRTDGPKKPAGGDKNEFLRLEYMIDLQKREGTEEIWWRSMCINACQGPPPFHPNHEACDRLCDRPCEAEHAYHAEKYPVTWITPISTKEGPSGHVVQWSSWTFEYINLKADVSERGFDLPQVNPTRTIQDFKRKLESYKIDIRMGHLVRPPHVPCAYQEYVLYGHTYDFVLTVSAIVMSEPAAGGQATEVGRIFDKYKIIIGIAKAPQSSVSALPAGILCACEKKQRPRTGSDPPKVSFGQDFKLLPTDTRTRNYAALMREPFNTFGNFTVTGESMNNFFVSFNSPEERALFLPAGTRLVPNDPSVQEGVVAEEADILSVGLTLSEGTPFIPQKVRMLCAEMNKKEPTSSTRFAISFPKDDAIRRLANFTAQSRFRGPWDQARIWIYTDDATYEDVAERLIPAVSRGTYVRMLHDVLTGPLPSAKYKKLAGFLKPEFLAEINRDPAAAEWAAQMCLASDERGVLNAVRGKAATWLQDEDGLQYLSAMCVQLLDSPSTAARATARELLRGVPNTLKSNVAESSILRHASIGLLSNDENEVLETLELYELYRTVPTKKMIERLAKSSPSQKVREKATSVLKIEADV